MGASRLAVEPFTILVVGSLPRPLWLRQVIEERKKGAISCVEAEGLLDDAIPSAIRLQERAGIDFVSDGVWRRESYVKVVRRARLRVHPRRGPDGHRRTRRASMPTSTAVGRPASGRGAARWLRLAADGAFEEGG